MDEVLSRRLVGAGVLLAGAFALTTLLPDAGPRSGRPIEHVVTYDLRTGQPVDLPELAPKPVQQPAPQAAKPAATTESAPEGAEPAIRTTPAVPPEPKPVERKIAESKPPSPKTSAPPTVSHPVLKVDESFGENATAPKATASGGWFLQIGSFESEANAGAVLKKLRNAGMPALIQAVPTGKKLWYRVRVGPYATESAATKVLTSVREKSYQQARLVKPDPAPAAGGN